MDAFYFRTSSTVIGWIQYSNLLNVASQIEDQFDTKLVPKNSSHRKLPSLAKEFEFRKRLGIRASYHENRAEQIKPAKKAVRW